MAMSRKHYVMFADCMKTAFKLCNTEEQVVTVLGFADAAVELFAGDNPRFDREKFLTACEYHPIAEKYKFGKYREK